MRLKVRRAGSAGLLALAALCLVLPAPAARGQAAAQKPITKENLIHALEDGGKTRPKETARTYIKLVEKYGVAFKLTEADEARVRRAGSYLAAEGLELLLGALRDNYRPDASAAMAELVQQNADLIQIIKATTEEAKKLKADGGATGNREKLEALREALTQFSGRVQYTLYNGSQPALQKMDGDQTGQDLADFYEALDLLAETSEEQATKLGQIASSFALDPGYAALAKAIRQRAELFKRVPRYKGKITREQAAQIAEAVELWKQVNEQLEAAVRQLNDFIRELE